MSLRQSEMRTQDAMTATCYPVLWYLGTVSEAVREIPDNPAAQKNYRWQRSKPCNVAT